MEKKAQLIDLFRRLRESPQVLFTAEVKKVDGNTCTVEIHGLEIDGVRLMPTSVNADSQLLITPAVGSYVLVGDLSSGSHSNLCVLCTQTLATVDLTIEKTHLVVDKTGITYTDKTNGDLNLRIGQTGSSQSNGSEETVNLKVGDSTIVVKKDEVDLTLKNSALKVVDNEVDLTVGNSVINVKKDECDLTLGGSSFNVKDGNVDIKVGTSSITMAKEGKIVLNKGGNGNLINIQDLTDKLNSFINSYNTHKHTDSKAGGTSAPLILASKLEPKHYEDANVTH